jgi:uncharacterized membrane protein
MLRLSIPPFEIRVFRLWLIFDLHGLLTGRKRRWRCAWHRKNRFI